MRMRNKKQWDNSDGYTPEKPKDDVSKLSKEDRSDRLAQLMKKRDELIG
jgi:hypothetical protein